jgi:hypothetical protein
MMTDVQMGISDHQLERMIRTTPRAYRKEVIERIRKLEYALELTGAGALTWKDALDRYRLRKKATTSAQMAMSGVLFFPLVVIDYLRDLDDTFRRIRNFNPEDFMTESVVSRAAKRVAESKRPKAQIRAGKLNEIGLWLKTKEYAQSLDKNGLIVQATVIFQCGETDVKDSARKAGLTRKYRQSPR